MASAVRSVEQSLTTITLISRNRGDSSKTARPLRAAFIRYFSLKAGTITESVVLVRFRSRRSRENRAASAASFPLLGSTRFVAEVALMDIQQESLKASQNMKIHNSTISRPV